MNRLRERAVSLLLVAVMILGFLPQTTLTALAADDSIKLTGCDFTGMTYHSEALGNASIHTIQFNYAGGMTGFCGDHGKKMSRTLIGQTWGNKTEITDPTVKMMMAYYYDHTLGKFTDAAIAKGVNNVWDDDYVYYMNAWIQAIIWLYRTGQLTNPVEDCAEELMWVFNCLKGENHTSIDECTAGSETSFRDTTQYIFTLGPETWGLADVYLYEFTGAGNENYPPELIQSVVIGNVEHTSTPESYSLTVKKVDATNTSLGLPGAAFHIVKQGSTESWDVVTGSGGTYTLTNLSAGTYAITETSAPDGYTIDNAGPDYVVLPSNGEASVTKVFTDTPTVTVRGSIRKVDRDNPSRGLAGATIAIQGVDNSFYGEYQTGAGGALEGLTWSSLTPGTYRAWEIAAPEGYSLDPSDVKTFRISAETPEVQLVFKNDAKVKVRLTKLDASDNPLAGAIFNVFRDGQIIATEATDANGQITISDVETGMYAFVETFAPDGYAINDQPVIIHVSQADIEGGGVISVTAVDKRLPDLTIQKKDAATGEVVANTVFEIQGVRTGYHKEVVTGNDGTATLTGIPVDYYDVTEKNVPAPYVVSNEPTQTVWLGAGEHPTLVFSNLQEPKLSIIKIDAETSTPIAGVVFSVQGIDVDYSADWTTGADGKYEAQITPGSYRITETSVPAPYVVSANNVRTVALRAGSEQQLVFENLKNPLLNLTKIDALDGRTIPGTVFAVQGVDNSFSGNWTTGADGTVSERIAPGTYRITEVSVPAPYYLPENETERVKTISLQPGDIRSLVFKDYRTPTLTIYKLDSVSGAPIEGAQFHVTYTRVSDIPDAPATYDFGTLYSNADGEIPLHETGVKLYPGKYTVTETAPAPGFQMREPTTQSVTINGSESRSVTFYNAPLNAIIVEKYDAQTGRALPGATFRLRYLGGASGSGGTVIGIKTTGASGSAIWTGLEAGTYIVDEISAPEGYNILRSSETVYLSDNGTQSVVTVSFENSQNGGLLIRKIDAKTKLPMAGVEFLVTDSRGAFIGTGNGKFITDADGSILIGNVTPGTTLVVRETRTLPGYILDTTPQTCVVQEGKTTTLEFRNEPDGIIIIYKKDAVTGAALSGVQFTVTSGSGELVAVADGMISSNGVYYTDSNGRITLDGLKPDTYVITETATISGYVIDRTPHTIAVKANDTQTLTITNRPRGGLIIMKLSRQTRQPLAGAEFRIVPADESLFTDNEGLTSPNNLYVTDADGQISLSNLTPGAYVITETNAPEGYSLDSEAQTVTVRSGRTESVSFYDSELAILKILKRDAVSKQPLADAEFTVTTADGTRLGDNNGLFITDSDGTATVTDLQPNSAVIVAESSSPAGYVMNATPKSVIVRSGTVNSLVFDDEPKTTLIVHKYVSGTRNEPLAGVEFKVTDSKGNVRGMNNGVYYTDASGDFMVTGLDPGLTVTVRETKTVDGYVLDGTPQEILIKAGERQELTFWNQRKGTLIVRKLDSVTGSPISGAEFHIAYANGNPVDANNGRISSNGRYVTDSRGEITLTDVTGTIIVTETKAAEGYYISPENRSQTVIVNPEDAQTITFFNTPTQTLILQKYVTDTTTPIQGVSFHITDSAGNAVGSSNGDFVTNRDGQIVLTGLIPGTTITARESSVPDDYVLDATPHSILIRSGEAQTLTVYNQLRASLILQKIDSATGNPLAGAQFKITTANGAEIAGFSGSTANNGVFTTDRAGQITLNKLTPGAYVLTETKAPDGYVLNTQPQTILLGAGETKTVTVGNAVKGSLIILKFDSVTRQPLAGAEFKIMTAEGTLVAANGGRTSSNGIYATDANGQITLSGLAPDTYIVTETKAPDNYYLNVNSQTVVVTADDVQTLSFYDEPFASLTILKRDSVTKAPLAGAEFSVKDVSGEIITNCITGTDGTATVSGLTPNASLVITETSAPAGYVLSETPQTVRVRSDAPNSVAFEDAPSGTLVIRKFIAGTANEPLSGVAFKVIYGNGKNVGPDDGVYYTDAAGEITLTGLTPGATVKAREIRTVDGFTLDGTPQDIEIQAGQTQQLTFWNARKGSLLIKKLDSLTQRPLSGVMFRITTATGEYVPNNDGHTSSNGFFTTDSAGEILLTNVTGTLVVTEFSTISGYVIDEATRSQTVVVTPDDTQTLVFYNNPMTSLTVQKYVTGTTTPLKGAKFFVSDSHGVGLGDSNGTFTTDDNGRFVISDLIPGLSVTVKETEAPDGYVLDSTPQTVRMRSGISAQTLTFYNSPKGSVSVRKLDAVTEQSLAGAEFKVTSANGVPLDNDGGKISTNGIYRTDDNGQFLITKVQPGVYTLTETKAPDGYILDATPLTITVSADDAQTITVKNKPKQTLTVQKFVSGTTAPLSGVEFLVTDNRGAVIGPSNGIYTTDDNGRFVVSGLTPGQTITVKETKTVSGYILNDKPQSIAIEAGDAQTLTFYNEAKSALLIVKRDSVTEQPLKGAEFQVLTADGKFVDDMGGALSSNGIYTTDERGQILISGLNPGVLVVKETKAPDGYVPDDKPQTVELKASETQTLTFRDVPKQTVTVQKYVEGTTTPLPGVTFLITDGGGNRIGAGEYVTDANGRIEIPGVNPGTMIVAREVKTASGYALNGSPKTLEVKVGTLNALTFYDEPLSTLIIRKYIEGTANEPLAGVAFKVVDGSGANVGPDDGVYYTDSAGEIRIDNLEAGTVIKAREIKTVDGFVLDGTPQDILIQNGAEQELVFWNKRQGTLTISKLDSVTRQPLSGVEFKVAYADGRAIGDGRYFTDNRGEINITGINGTVTVTETATIPGYVMDADSRTQTVTVTPMEGRTVTFTNTPMQTLTVRKFVQGTTTPIPGAVFKVSDSSGATLGNNNGEFTTDSNGEITVSGLIPGVTVTAREIRPASGYVLNGEAQSVKIKSGDAQTLTFYNVPQESLTIRKYAEGTTNPISGVTFYVTDGAGTPVGSGEFLTDDNGTVTIPGFAPGDTVIVREVKTVKGYALNGTPKTLKIASGQENALTFYDAPLSVLLVHKYVDGTANEPLPGVTFKITDASGANVGNSDGIYVTDASGDITIPNLEAGTVIKAREVKTVDGYLLDGTPQDIEITKAAVNELTFWNVPAQTLIIEKRASDTDAPLQGVTFVVRDSGGAFVGENNGEFTTDQNGQIVIRGLVPGVTITAQETKTVSGYVLDETPQNILIQNGDAQKLVFRNAPKGALTVRKVDDATGQPLSGAEFRILTVQGQPVDNHEGQTSSNGIYTTDANGEIVIAKLQPGVYKVSEIKAPDGYVLDTTAQTVTVNANDSQTLTFRDVPKQGLTIQKYVQGSTTPIVGAKFLITDSDGNFVGESNGEFTTDENGRIFLANLTPGVTITAKEIGAADGYVLNGTPKSIKIKSGEAQTLTFYNVPTQRLVIYKYDAVSSAPLSGVTFHVTDTSGKALGSSNGDFTTDANGQIVIDGLAPGMSVTAQETKTVSGYVLDTAPQTIRIESGEAQSLVFRNLPKGALIVRKTDSLTEQPLSGAEFKVTTAKGEPVSANEGATSSNGVYVTDDNGQFAISKLEPGAYVVTEIKAPEGYVLNSQPQTVTVEANDAQTLLFRNAPKQSLTIRKFVKGTDTPLKGVAFMVVDGSGKPVGNGNGEFVTDENGRIVISGLTPGMTVIAHEIRTVQGYALNGAPQNIQIVSGEAQTLTFYDEPLSTLVIRKFIEGTDNNPLSGVAFKVTDGSGKNVGPDDGVYYTDDAGEISIPNLEAGMTLKVREIKTVDGYVLDGTPQDIQILSAAVQTLTFWNAPRRSLTIQKYEKGTSTPIAGARFLVTDDGRPVGESNGEFTTDENGRIVLANLTPGTTVTAQEIEAASGYVLDATPKSVKIKSGAAQTLTFYNVPTQRLVIQKYVTDSTTPIPGVTFHVTDTSGKALGNANGDFVTDANGRITISGLAPGLSVTAQETKTVSGYILDATPQTIQIQSGEAQTLTFFNTPKGAIIVKKIDAETDAPLSGAEFKVTNAKGEPVDQNNGQTSTNGIYRTDDNGQFTLSDIQPGVYIITEIKAPDGYVLDNNSQTVTVNANDAQTLTFRDMPLQSVVIQKYIDGTTKPLAGVTFLVTDTNGAKIGAGEYVTDANGQIVLTGLAPGTSLVVREVKTVKGYALNGAPQTIQVGTGNAGASGASLLTVPSIATAANATGNGLTFYDEPLSTLVIHKFVTGTDNEPLSGVAFKVVDGSGKNVGNSDGVFVTDDSGDIVITGLERGTVIKAREIKTVDGYVLDGTPQDIQIQNSELHELTFWNAPKQSLVIRKFATNTTTPIPGVTFRVTDSEGKAVGASNGEFVTDANGEILITGLTPGVSVTAKETKTVSGYVLDSTPQTVKIKSGEAQSLVFYNSPKGSLSVIKRDSLTDAPLSGAEFKVTDASGKTVDQNEGRTSTNGVYVTDANGQFTIVNIQPGAYVVKETKAPEGYVLDKTPQTVTVNANDAQTLTFRDVPKQRLTVQKYEKGTTTPISGAKFLVTDNGEPVGASNGEFVTDDNGQFVLSGLTPGATITVKEIEAAEGYVLDGTPKSVKIKSGVAQSLTFYDIPTQPLTVQKYEKGTTTPISGAKFLVTDNGEPVGDSNGEFTTDDNGRFVLTGLVPGDTITVKEIEAAEGYALDGTPKSVKIKSGDTQTLTFYNVPLQSLVIQKYIDGTTKPLSGVTFLVTDNNGNRVGNGEYVTDDNGQIILNGLTPGMSLVVREVKTVKGYVLNGAPQTIQIGEAGANAVTLSAQPARGASNANGNSLTFYDEPLSTLVVHKYVKGTDNEPLPGVTFKVVDGAGKNIGNSDGLFVTDDNGDITIPDLEPETVIKVREVKTVDGYVLDGTPQDIEIRNSELHELTFWNSPKQSLVIRIFVTDTTTPIPGATFHVAYSDGKSIGDFVTDNNGEILISGLVPGVTVTAKETKAVSGYILDSTPQSVKIKSGETQTITFYNSPKGSLSVVKLDSLTERPLSGAEFRVMTAKGEFVDQNEGQTSTNGVYRTDESGRFTISGLMPGNYVVTEIKAPDGYVLDSEPQTVTVNANDAQTLTFRDAPVQTLIVEVFVTDTTTPIPGTSFIVTAQDGKPIGDANGEFIADENGRITIPGLTPGTSVTVKETKSAPGYLPDGTPKTILIKSGDAQNLRFYNSPAQTLTVQMFVTGTTDPIPGVTFHITDSDGKVIGNENGDFVTDKDGQIVIPGLIPGTSVTVKETKTVSGYVLDTTPQTIEIRSGDAQSLTFFNAPKGALVIRAVDSVTEETLPDMEFKIVAANGEPLDSNEGKTSSNGIYTTDSNGTISITKVQPGIYHIVETKVPDGYVLNEEAQTVTVNADDTQTLIFRNVPKQSLTIQVYEDGTTKPIPGIAFLLKDSGGAFIGPDRGEYVTDANGQITVSGLVPGVTVIANEIRTVAGYVLNNVPQNIKIQTGDAQKLTFFNIPLESLTIWKFQKGTTTPLQGVAFLVVDGNGEPINGGEYVTDENGRIVIDGLEPGITVTAREIRTVKGYQLNGNPQNIKIASGKDNALTFYDDPLSTLIVRLFVDGTENEPISGAAFKVVDGSGKAVGPDDGVYYTDHAGMFTLENLEPGVTIKARLIKIADEFVLDGTPQDILMESGDVQSLTFWAKRAGSLTIRSMDSVTRQPIPNVEFKVTYADGRPVDTANGQQSSNGQYFTDANGEIRITGVIGTIIVTEEKAADNYTMDSANRSQTAVVRPADGQTLTFFDAPAQGLMVQLYVKGTTTPISGAKFLLTDGTGAKLGDENGEFTTDENGRFSLSGLKPGLTVKVKQISTLDAYMLDGTPKTVTVKTDSEQTVTVYNAPKQTLTVRLYVKGTTTPIPGAKFLLRDSGGALVGENNGVFTTDDNGGFTITGLTPGVTITATQTDTVSGYVLETTPQSILIKSGNAQSLVFYNAPKGALVVKKLDAATEGPLAGAEFKILAINGTPVDDNEGKTSTKGIYRTDDNGEITLLKLEPGVYTVTETKAPSGYVLDSEPQTVTVNADDRQTLTFRDNPLQSLTITKYEDGTTKPLAGVTFMITDANGNRVGNGEYTTDRNGQITITGLTPGMTVIAREVRTVKGYVLNGNPQTITIGNGANALTSGAGVKVSAGNSTATGNALTFYDEPLSTLVIRKFIEGTDNAPLANVEFKITDGRGAKVGNGTYYTDKSGEIRVENLEPGMTVTVRETKTVSGYVLDGTPKTAEIPSGDVLEMVFWNSAKQTLKIQKFVEGTSTPIRGVTFLVTDQTGAPVGDDNGEFVTDENGEIVISGLTPGAVITARETKAASGYVLDTQPKSITIRSGAAQTLRFYNSPQGSLIIEKRDKLTQKPLSGATFQIMSAGGGFVDNAGGRLSSNGQYTTDANGQIILTDLNPGTLTVKEISAPSGYELDAAPQTVKVNANDTQTLTFYDTPQQTLTILKMAEDTNAPLQGVTFLVTAGDGSVVGPNNGLYTTDANGLITIHGLTPGVNVTVRESRTVSGYQLDTAPQSIQIRSGEAQRLTFYNKPVEPLGGLLIKKMDAATKEPLSGVAFKVTRADGSVVGVTNGEFVTDGSGLISVRDLEPGTYVVREIRAKDGYLLDDTAKTIEIKDRQTYTLEFYNAAKGGLILHKLDSVTKEPLSGVQFKIAYADGSFVNRGNLSSNGLYSTNKEGQIVISGITGTVVITEMQTVDGYKIDPATRAQTVEIKANETQSVTVYNDPVGGVEIIKVNEDDRTIRIPNVTFEIRKTEGGLVKTVTTGQNGRVYVPLDAGSYYALEIETAKGYRLDATPQYFDVEDGKTTTLTVRNKAFSGILIHKTDSVTGKGIYDVPFLLYDANKNPIRQYESDQNGYVYIDNLPNSGRYYIRELENPGYVPDTQLKTVYVEAGETIEIEWKNQPVTGQIQVYKYAAEDNAVTGTAAGAPLQGAVYEIVNVRSGQVVGQIVTDARGVAASEPLPLARYQVKEVTAPAYWQIDATVHDVTLEYAGQIIKLSAFDKPARLGVTLTKSGLKEVLAGDRMIYRFTVANTSNVALKNFFWHDKLPYDVTTGYAITTGVYSARLNYRVLYKTNYNEYRVLASNLLSTNNYALPLSALPLEEGEVVTDIRFDFGTVPAGFYSVTQPTLTVSVSPKATNGYRIVNRADAGGQYGETWETANAGWTTIVRRLSPPKPLPKTGY